MKKLNFYLHGKFHGINQTVSWIAATLLTIYACQNRPAERNYWKFEKQGAFISTDTTRKEISLVFTGHEFADGSAEIQRITGKYGIKASFFFTGDFYRNPALRETIMSLKQEGHYLGAHSDKHLLYCDWERRDSLFVTRDQFMNDLDDNYNAMAEFGIKKEDAMFFLPPYEWYNQSVSNWIRDYGLCLVNFSPGTSSNQDWTYPELGKSYISSDSILQKILRYEEIKGMNGFILLTHIGTDPRRTDKFYNRLDELIGELSHRGYTFRRIDQ